jgi:hypothetical protein
MTSGSRRPLIYLRDNSFLGQRYLVEGIATTGRKGRAQNWMRASPVSWSNTKLRKKNPKNTKLSSRTT